jgi:Uma2 family endonuclease
MPIQSEYVTAAEALKLLEVSEGKLTAMLKSGELPWRPNPRNKRAKLIRRSDIEAWLANAPPSKKAIREQKARYTVAQETIAPWAEIVPDAPYPMTAEELARLPEDRWHYELVDGRLARMPPTGAEHGDVALKLAAELYSYVKAHRLGRVFAAETGFLLTIPGTINQTELAPDAAFVKASRLPPRQSEAYRSTLSLAPDLVVEVASPTQYRPEMGEKARLWLKCGVRLVWVVWPRSGQVDLWLPGNNQPTKTLKAGDALDGLDVVPGFSYSLAEVFS